MSLQRLRRPTAGFTLIELMIVVIILSVLTGMIAPHLAGTYHAALLRASARELVTAVRLASSEAVTRNQVVRLVIDPQRHRFQLECRENGGTSVRSSIQDVPGATGELDARITVDVRSPGAGSNSRQARSPRVPAGPETERGHSIPFRPDGTTEAREIILRDREGFGIGLRIQPTTARVETVRLEVDPGLRSVGSGSRERDRRTAP